MIAPVSWNYSSFVAAAALALTDAGPVLETHETTTREYALKQATRPAQSCVLRVCRSCRMSCCMKVIRWLQHVLSDDPTVSLPRT